GRGKHAHRPPRKLVRKKGTKRCSSPKSSVLTGQKQKQGRHRAVRLRNHPNCFVGVRVVTAQEPESVVQAVLVLPAIFRDGWGRSRRRRELPERLDAVAMRLSAGCRHPMACSIG